MTYFPDLSLYSYQSSYMASGLLNIGWLSSDYPFSKAVPSREFVDRLHLFCEVSFVQTRGLHLCDFCLGQQHGEIIITSSGLLLGGAEIRVLDESGVIYCAPNLVYHYVQEHHYSPPIEFEKAVMSCPLPSTAEYSAALLEIGLKGTQTLRKSPNAAAQLDN